MDVMMMYSNRSCQTRYFVLKFVKQHLLIFRDTNTYAKLWFRILKHQILEKKTQLKPKDFVLRVYDDVKGR